MEKIDIDKRLYIIFDDSIEENKFIIYIFYRNNKIYYNEIIKDEISKNELINRVSILLKENGRLDLLSNPIMLMKDSIMYKITNRDRLYYEKNLIVDIINIDNDEEDTIDLITNNLFYFTFFIEEDELVFINGNFYHNGNKMPLNKISCRINTPEESYLNLVVNNSIDSHIENYVEKEYNINIRK